MRWTSVVVLVLFAVAAAPATRPATRPAAAEAVDEREVLRLVAMLADPDATRRDDAAAKLRRIGKPALPMLRRAAESGDPELAGRANAVINRIGSSKLPGGLPPEGVTFSQMSLTAHGDGSLQISGTFDGRKVSLTQGEKITMSVTGVEDGKEETVHFTADDPEQLKEQSDEAHELFQRITANMRLVNGGGVVLGPVAREPMDLLRETLDAQMARAATPAKRRAEVLAAVAKLRELRVARPEDGDDVRDRKLKEFFEASDALRKTLAELNLDAGQLLPPPPNARLGVQLVIRDDRLQVEKVVAGSRGDKVGLRPGDYIHRVNLKEVRDITQLKDAVAAARGPLSVEVVRDQKSVVLEEKK